MAGYGVEPTLERVSDDTCERLFVAVTCHLIAGLEADGFEAPHARKDYSGDFNYFACEQPTRASERSFPWPASARASHDREAAIQNDTRPARRVI